jgi:2-amino-4-hydroxy-6-hydroxymethyldihydropteridine diphosphokinase
VKTVYLSLGSNLGEREKHIERAVEELAARGVHVVRQSPLYETEPVGEREQPWFLNRVVEGETGLMPRQLLHVLLEIEEGLGRKRLVPGGPRVIDIDILLYGSSVVRTPELEIPHPRMALRRFVLVPLNDLAAAVRHPVLQKTVVELLAETPDRSQVRAWRKQTSRGADG